MKAIIGDYRCAGNSQGLIFKGLPPALLISSRFLHEYRTSG